MYKKRDISIVIVNYSKNEFLFNCLKSIFTQDTKYKLEVLVIDNSEDNSLETNIKKQFPQVNYIPTYKNIGFPAGNNIGAQKAVGQYLFFLNPDTVLLPKVIDTLVYALENNTQIGIIAPILLDKNRKPYSIQGTGMLTPLTATICFSFLNKLFANNSITINYWLKDWDMKSSKYVENIIGAAFMIRKSLFHKISGFDENFFLYFEDIDLCSRVREIGFKIIITPAVKIIHYWSGVTPKSLDTKKIFKYSRFYFFKKRWGLLTAIIIESFLRSGEWLAQLF